MMAPWSALSRCLKLVENVGVGVEVEAREGETGRNLTIPMAP